MKKFVSMAFAAFLVLAGATLHAQPRFGNPSERAKKQAAKLTEAAKLNEEQAKQVEAIYLDFNTKMEADMKAQVENGEQPSPNPLLVEKLNADIKKVLTPEQYEVYLKQQQERQRPNGEPGGRRNHGGPKEGRPQ